MQNKEAKEEEKKHECILGLVSGRWKSKRRQKKKMGETRRTILRQFGIGIVRMYMCEEEISAQQLFPREPPAHELFASMHHMDKGPIQSRVSDSKW